MVVFTPTYATFSRSYAEKNPHLSTTSVGSFQLNPPFRVGEIIFDGEIPCGDEIRLDGGWVDLISSAKQISSEQSEDFIALCAISLKNEQSCSIIQLDKLEFGGGLKDVYFSKYIEYPSYFGK